MKIKILTFHRELNYGANLQAYALRHYLNALGHEVSFIDFRRSQQGNFVVRFAKKWIGRSFSSTLRKVRAQYQAVVYLRKCRPIFSDFQRQFIPSTAEIYNSPQSVRENPPEADCYIVGSDQVWSPRIVIDNDLPIYFLNFGRPEVRRIAYAVSSGGETFPNEFRQKIANYLSCFNGVGVREESLGEHLSEIGFLNARWTPDPTVLVDWRSHFDLTSVNRTSTVGVFLLNESSYENVSVDGLPARTDALMSGLNICDFSKDLNGPVTWVEEIASKKLLITDSYHAVLFALYSRTPFLFVKWGVSHKRDHRIISLLEKMGLTDRAVDTVNLTRETVDAGALSVDWSAVSDGIREMRRGAEDFLRIQLR